MNRPLKQLQIQFKCNQSTTNNIFSKQYSRVQYCKHRATYRSCQGPGYQFSSQQNNPVQSNQQFRKLKTLQAAISESGSFTTSKKKEEVLQKLRNIIDPDLNQDIVSLGFIKNLDIQQSRDVSFEIELTTPACPVKDDFRRQAESNLKQLSWIDKINIQFSAQPQTDNPLNQIQQQGGVSQVKHIIAVSSCKGGVGKSTVAVNLAFSLTQMGAKVGIFDADVYGPSLPTMISPENTLLEMDPESKQIKPVDFMGVKCVSFGYAQQGSAIMRGAMVSGLIQQLITTSDWGNLDYLIVDFPPGTGDIQLTLSQSVQFSSAVVVTTPQKLAFIDVEKGVRMFARLMIPCVAVVENMSFFDGDDGKRYYPFGKGSGQEVASIFGIPNVTYLPMIPALSQAGDEGQPLVVSNPSCQTSNIFQELGAKVVQEVAKLQYLNKSAQVKFNEDLHVIQLRYPKQIENGQTVYYDPFTVRKNDTSARQNKELTDNLTTFDQDIKPVSVSLLGNYAIYIMWEDRINQVASFDLLKTLPQVDIKAQREKVYQQRQIEEQISLDADLYNNLKN